MIPPIAALSSVVSATPATSSPALASSTSATPTGSSSFANVLGSALDQLNQTTSNASTLAVQGATGQANVADVTMAASEAQLAVQLVTTVRNEGVTAFNSIMSMTAG